MILVFDAPTLGTGTIFVVYDVFTCSFYKNACRYGVTVHNQSLFLSYIIGAVIKFLQQSAILQLNVMLKLEDAYQYICFIKFYSCFV